MSDGFRSFLITFFLTVLIFGEINILERGLRDFYFWQEIAKNPSLLTAQVPVKPVNIGTFKPRRNNEASELSIGAKSALSIWIPENFRSESDEQEILFQKSGNEKLPIASLSKLMSGFTVSKYYDPEQKVLISKEAAVQPGNGAGIFKIEESFRIKDLLYSMLIESNNSAAYILADVIGENVFVDLMNSEAKELGLENTYFVNPDGLDPDEKGGPINYSTAEDISILARYLLSETDIWRILSLSEFDVFLADSQIFHHKLLNTNELLSKKEKPWSEKIIGGKTGWTPEAGGCLILILKAPGKAGGYIINVILGSEDRFGTMENLIDWIYEAYWFEKLTD